MRLFLAALVCAIAITEVIWAWPRLPDTVASHFDASGRADGSMAKTPFFALLGGVFGLIALVTFGMGAWLSRIPDGLINLPHREHWLAPERRAESLAWLNAWLQEVGILTLALIAGMLHLTIQANLDEGGRLVGFGWWLGGYVALLVLWLVRLFARFRRPRAR